MGSSKGWLVPLTGVAAVVLLIAGFAIQGESPTLGDDSAREIRDFYLDNKDQLMLGAALQALSLTFLVFFGAYLRRLVRSGEGERGMLSHVAFGGVLIFAAGGAFDATLTFTMAETAEDLRPPSMATLMALFENDFLPMAVGIQLLLLGVGLSAVRHATLPKWLGVIALLLAVVAVTPVGFAAFMGLGLWILVTSVLLAVRARRMSESARSPI